MQPMQRQRQQLINHLRQQGILDQHVLQAINDTPRHLFVDEALAHNAYDNITLPIGVKQTISQPYIVARMTELLQLTPRSRVLEIGTGSGYQTVVLSLLATHVYSVERIKSLLWQARQRFKKLERNNISTHYSDGTQGWATHAPFDAILVTAAAPQLPQALCHQLVKGGRLVIPVGEQHQTLLSVTRYGEEFTLEQLEPVRFVPLIQGELA